jgi:hypothetical protein
MSLSRSKNSLFLGFQKCFSEFATTGDNLRAAALALQWVSSSALPIDQTASPSVQPTSANDNDLDNGLLLSGCIAAGIAVTIVGMCIIRCCQNKYPCDWSDRPSPGTSFGA